MHGLIFETSIWLLAGSTRFYQKNSGTQSFQIDAPKLNSDIKRSSIILDKLSDKRPKATIWIRSSDVTRNSYSGISTNQECTKLVNHLPTLRHKFYLAVLECYANPIRQACKYKFPKNSVESIERAETRYNRIAPPFVVHLVFAACRSVARSQCLHHQGKRHQLLIQRINVNGGYVMRLHFHVPSSRRLVPACGGAQSGVLSLEPETLKSPYSHAFQ